MTYSQICTIGRGERQEIVVFCRKRRMSTETTTTAAPDAEPKTHALAENAALAPPTEPPVLSAEELEKMCLETANVDFWDL